MAISPLLSISANLSLLGKRLAVLEAGGVPAFDIATLFPSTAWDGAAGSGYGGSPPAQTGTAINGRPEYGFMHGTVAPVVAWLNPTYTDTMFSEDLTVMVEAHAAAADGILGGIESVKIDCEGNSVTLTEQSLVDLPVAGGGTRKAYVWAAKLPYAEWSQNGGADLYATIQPKLAGLATRVIGPMRVFRKPGPDKTIDISPSLPALQDVRYPNVQDALTRVQTTWNSGENIRFRCTEDVLLDAQTKVFVANGANTAAKRGTVTIDANGFDCLAKRTSGLQPFRPGFNGLVWKGWKVDVAAMEQLYNELSASWRIMAFEDCDIFSSNGAAELPGSVGQGQGIGKSPRGTSQFNTPLAFIRCRIHDMNTGPGNSAHIMAGCELTDITGDASTQNGLKPFFIGYNTMKRVSGAPLRRRIPSFTPVYNGPGTGTFDIVQGAFTINRALVLKVNTNGTPEEVARFTSTNLPGTAVFDVDQVIAAINASGTGWTATAAPNSDYNSIKFGGIGIASSGIPSVPVSNVPSGTQIVTAVDVHCDIFAQLQNNQLSENSLMINNIATDCDGQPMFPAPGGTYMGAPSSGYNIAFIQNMCTLDPNGIDTPNSFNQISGGLYHLLMVGNTTPNTGLKIRRDDAATVFDAFSRVDSNIFLSGSSNEVSSSNGQINAPPLAGQVRRNVFMEPGIYSVTGPNVSDNESYSAGARLANFPMSDTLPFAIAAFLPAAGQPVAALRKAVQVGYDINGKPRGTTDAPGAVSVAS